MPGTLVLLSGGMDSTVLLAVTTSMEPDDVLAVSVDYGQRHARELVSAKSVAAYYGVSLQVVDLSVLRSHLPGSALTDQRVPVPDGHYAEESMRATVVPNRNLIMLAVAGGIAVANGLSTVATAVHAGDHYIYPDCRPEFIKAASAAIRLGTQGFGDVNVAAPFNMLSKADIATLGTEQGAPFHLSWSCYKGGEVHCGACGTCYERREAFNAAGLLDPTEYLALPDYAGPAV